MSRYKILKFLFGILSLVLFYHQVPKQQDEDEEKRANLEADLTALQAEKAFPNPNVHFFVSCGGFIS